MSSNITLTAATRQNLLSLQDTAALMSTTQNRLSTGRKVNSALDNPTNFFTSQALNSRSSDLSGLLDNISNGIQVIQAANQGITNLQKLTDQLKSTAQQALSSANAFTAKNKLTSTAAGTISASNILGTTAAPTTPAAAATVTGSVTGLTNATVLTDASLGFADGDAITIGSTTINIGAAGSANTATNIAEDATIGDLLSAIDTAIGGTGTAALDGGSVKLTGPNDSTNLVVGGDITKLGIAAQTYNFTPPVGGSTALSGALSVTVGTGTNAQTASVTFGTGTGQVSTLDGLNKILNEKGAQATINSSGKLEISTTNEAGTKAISVTGAAAQTLFGAATAATVTNGSGFALGGDGQTARNKLMNDFNDLLIQIDQQAKDASYNGINLLNGDNLKITFNETNSSQLNVRGSGVSSVSLGLNNLTSADFQDSDAISAVMNKITSANTQLKNLSSTYGSNLSVVQNRQDFTKNLINILDTGSSNLVNADMNEEAANSQALTTRNSLAISALSLANQAQQGILQLLR